MEIRKIDFHVHTILEKGPERLRGGTFPTPGELRPIYDYLCIEKGVQLPLGAPEHMHDPITSKESQKIANTYPETLSWWFCYMDPRMGTNSPTDNLSYYLDYFKEQGAKGVGELQANIYIDDPRMLNLLYHCEKCKMPVLIHFGIPNTWTGVADDPGLPRLEKVLKMFPKLTIIGHAAPFWYELNYISQYGNRNHPESSKIQQGGRLLELMRKYPNLMCDLSANSGYQAMTRDPEFTFKFLEEFNERCFFGTDIADPNQINAPFTKLSFFLDNAYKEGNISKKTYEHICCKNALFLLND